MHILFISHSADLMGAELSLPPVVREAVRVRGHRVTVTVPAEGPLCAELTAAGAAVVVLPTSLWMGRRFNPVVGGIRLLQALSSFPRYRRYVARSKPDLVVTNSVVVPAGAFAARRNRIRHVWLIQESLLTNPSLRSALPRPTIARIIASLSDGAVVVSEFVAGQLLGVAPALRQKVRVIPPSIDPWGAVPEPDPRRDGTKLERLILLGRYSAEKGQAEAIEALGHCLKRGRAFELKLAAVGDHTKQQALRDLARAHRVEHLVEISEWTSDPLALYAWADATLMLSRNEAYGRVTAESLLAGTPVIGYRAGATTEIVADGGGLLVEPRAEALAEALLNLAADGDSYASLRADARRRAGALGAEPPSATKLVDYLEYLQAKH
ncbi:glycosyltransferase family 4 protein [Micromonospora sp. NPDC050397]|uniref:glycosyltransferase family 4 protein n=1 Tax=Micromonospora sp. NPDC050397 TaxID=3364279 RepID=UPI00384C3B1A